MPEPGAAVQALAAALIERPSVSPRDAGCQALLGERLERAGFAVASMPFGDVANFWATHGAGAPTLIFAGHTDVVPPGPVEGWDSPPFAPTLRDGFLFGRGAADMKSSLAAMVVALERFVAAHPQHPGRLAMLVTSDEEADAVDGTAKVVAALRAGGERLDYCVVGEPSSSQRLGDVVRVGRRGSLSGTATVRGVQGHVAYPDQAVNPIHAALEPLRRLAASAWDAGDADFPPTSFQLSNVNAGTGAGNVIPGELTFRFNFRFSPAQTPAGLRRAVEEAFAGVPCEFEWHLSGEPFLTRPGALLSAVQAALRAELGIEAATSTSGGTSDGRFIAPAGAEVVELGPINATIHKRNECVALADLAPLARVYGAIAERLLGGAAGA